MSSLLQLWREVCGRSPASLIDGKKYMNIGAADMMLLGCEIERLATPAAQSAGQEPAAANFACYLIDHCEGETVTEELVQRWLTRMLADPQYAAPVNGGESETVDAGSAREVLAEFSRIMADASNWPDTSDERDALAKCAERARAVLSERAADTQQVGGDDIDLSSVPPAAYLSTDPGKWNRSALKTHGTFTLPVYTADQVRAAFGVGSAPSALTSPAKVSGDEREAFEKIVRSLTDPATHDEELAREGEAYVPWAVHLAWEVFKQARAALSADGGEDKRDAEHADMFWNNDDPERVQDSIHNVVVEAYDNGWRMGEIVEIQQATRLENIKVRIATDETGHISYEYLDAAIAANQAKGEAS